MVLRESAQSPRSQIEQVDLEIIVGASLWYPGKQDGPSIRREAVGLVDLEITRTKCLDVRQGRLALFDGEVGDFYGPSSEPIQLRADDLRAAAHRQAGLSA